MLRLSIGSCMLRLRLSIGSCMLRLRLSIGSCMLNLQTKQLANEAEPKPEHAEAKGWDTCFDL